MRSSIRHQEVGMSQWAIGEADTVLDTQGLTSCTGVAIYDPSKKIGHMLHSVGPLVQQRLVEAFFESVRNNTEEPEHLRAWARGNERSDIAPRHDYENPELEREYIENLIEATEIPEPNRNIRWGDNGIDMVLDCNSGRFVEGVYISPHHTSSQPIGLRYLTSLRNGEPFVDDIQASAAHMLGVLDSFLEPRK